MTDMVCVPAEKMDALREALKLPNSGAEARRRDLKVVANAARAVLAAASGPWAEHLSELATLRVRDEHYEILLADNLRLRAELDSLRDRVTALADEWVTPIANWLRSAYDVQDDSPTAEDVSNERLAAAQRMAKMRDQLAAIVRGSDDEAREDDHADTTA